MFDAVLVKLAQVDRAAGGGRRAAALEFVSSFREFVAGGGGEVERNVGSLVYEVVSIGIQMFDDDEVTDGVFSGLMGVPTGLLGRCWSEVTTLMFMVIQMGRRFDESRPLFVGLFRDDAFTAEFFGWKRFKGTIENVYMTGASCESVRFFREIVESAGECAAVRCVCLSEVVRFLEENRKRIDECGRVELALLLAWLVSESAHENEVFVAKSSFLFLSELLDNASPAEVVQCFSKLLSNRAAISFGVLPNVFEMYKQKEVLQLPIFDWIFSVVRENGDAIDDIESALPICQWLIDSIPFERCVSLVELVAQCSKRGGKVMFARMLSLFSRPGTKSANDYLCFINLCDRHLRARTLSLSFLVHLNFLHSMILVPPIDVLEEVMTQSEVFGQLVYEIYSAEGQEAFQEEVFPVILNVYAKHPTLSHCVAPFLTTPPRKRCVELVMSAVVEHKNADLVKSLSLSFIRCQVLAEFFVELKGLTWLEGILSSIIDIDEYSDVLSSLSSSVCQSEINRHIRGLGPAHPLFHVQEETAKAIVFGRSETDNPPILIYSLFPLLSDPLHIDPYNAFVLGKYLLARSENSITQKPYVRTVACRYLSDIAFKYVWENCGYDELESFCDTSSCDPFPLFQVYPSNEGAAFHLPFKCISFWFKLPFLPDANFIVRLFTADRLSLSIRRSNMLTVIYGGNTHLARIDPQAWNHVVIKLRSERASSLVKLILNNVLLVVRAPSPNEMFSSFSFNIPHYYLLLGPAIRISMAEKCHNIQRLYAAGPSYVEYSKPQWEEHIITPFDMKPQNDCVRSVPYRGFPGHFMEVAKASLVFSRIKSAQTQEDFDNAIHLIFELYNFLGDKLPNYYQQMLDAFCDVPQFLTKGVVFDLMKSVSKSTSKSQVLDETLLNYRAWTKISNDLLLYGLFNLIEGYNFGKSSALFQAFAASRLIHHPTSEYIAKCILISREFLPIAIDIIISYFVCGSNLVAVGNACVEDTSLGAVSEPNIEAQCSVPDAHSMDDGGVSFKCHSSNTLQLTIARCLLELFNLRLLHENTVNLLPFSTLKEMFFAWDVRLRACLLELMVAIEAHTPYITIDSPLLLTVASTVASPQSWTATMSLISKDGKKVTRQDMLPLLLALVWGAVVAVFHSMWTSGRSLPELESKLDAGLKVLKSNVNLLVENQDCVNFFRYWFPFAVNVAPATMSEGGNTSDNIDYANGIITQVLESAGVAISSDSDHVSEFRTLAAGSSFTDFVSFLSSVADFPVLSVITCPHSIGSNRKVQIFFEELAHLWISSVAGRVRGVHSEFFSVVGDLMSRNVSAAPLRLLEDVLILASLMENRRDKLFQKVSNEMNFAVLSVIRVMGHDEAPIMFGLLNQYIDLFVKIVGDKYLWHMKALANFGDIDVHLFDSFAEQFVSKAKLSRDKQGVASFLARNPEGITISSSESVLTSPRKDMSIMKHWNTVAHDIKLLSENVEDRLKTRRGSFIQRMEPVLALERRQRIRDVELHQDGEELLVPIQLGYHKRIVVPKWHDSRFATLSFRHDSIELDMAGHDAPIESGKGYLKLGNLTVAVSLIIYNDRITIVPREYPKDFLVYLSRGYWKRFHFPGYGLSIVIRRAEIDPLIEMDRNKYLFSGSTFRPFILECGTVGLANFGRRQQPGSVDDLWNTDNTMLKEAFEFPSSACLDRKWCNQKLSGKWAHSVALGNKYFVETPAKLCCKLSNETSMFLVIDRTKMQLTVVDTAAEKTLFRDCCAIYGMAKCLTSSSLMKHFVVDFSNGMTKVYRFNGPASVVAIRSRHFLSPQKSAINDIDGVCVTAQAADLLIWDFVNGREIRHIVLESDVQSLALDQNNAVIWASCQETVHTFTMSGKHLLAHKVSSTVTALCSVPCVGCLVGCENGDLYIVTDHVAKIDWRFDAPVKSIALHPSLMAFAAVDKYGNGVVCTSKDAHLSLPSAFVDACANCRKRSPTLQCASCGRWVCHTCAHNKYCENCL